MSSKQTLVVRVNKEEYDEIQKGNQHELYRTATDEWFAKLYQTDERTGLANVDQPIPYDSVLLEQASNQLLYSFKGLEVEEFLNHPEESDERFGFILCLGGPVT